MKTARLFLLPAILVISTLVATVYGIKLQKEVVALKTKLVAEVAAKRDLQNEVHEPMAPAELSLAADIIGLLTQRYGIRADVKADGQRVKVTATTEILYNYDTLLAWLTMLDVLPYKQASFKEVCIGLDCGGGASFVLDFTAAPAGSGKGLALGEERPAGFHGKGGAGKVGGKP